MSRYIIGDALTELRKLPTESVQCCITSPPYWALRDYGVEGQLGSEATPEEHAAVMVEVFSEVKRVLRKDGTLWLNYGDRHVEKQLCGMPWRVAFALQADGWHLRSDIIWEKQNPMPEAVTDRPTKAHEYLFLMAKESRYFYDADAIREKANPLTQRSTIAPNATEATGNTGGNKRTDFEKSRRVVDRRNKRTVWTIPSKPFTGWTRNVRRVRVAPDEVSDDTMRTTSPGCPVHGDRAGQAPTVLGDGHVRRSNVHTERRHHREQEQSSARAQVVLPLEGCSEHESSGLPSPPDTSAKPRSTQNHRKALDPSTNLPCKLSAQTESHTERNEELPELSEQRLGNDENSTSAVDCGDSRSSQTTVHIAGSDIEPDSSVASCSSECTCEFYREVTEETSHFATFPPALVTPCVLAGTSAKGCCSQCGAPWVRDVELSGGKHSPNASKYQQLKSKNRQTGGTSRTTIGSGEQQTRTTTGWSPQCTCNAEVIPCTVLDPFLGSGTVAEVCEALGRHWLGIELNPEYEPLIRKRTAQIGLFT